MDTKHCSKCDTIAPLETAYTHFVRDKHALDGYHAWCKTCRKATNKQYRKANPDKFRAYRHMYRAKQAANGGSFTPIELTLLRLWQGLTCCYCAKDVSNDYTLDHIYPIKRGGTSNITNMAIACPSCNASKNGKTLWQWQGLDYALAFYTRRKDFATLLHIAKVNP